MGSTNTATSALSNLLSNGGIGTGLNVQQLVSQKIQADSGPLVLLQNQQTQLNAQTSAWNNLTLDLTSLQSAVNNLTDITGGLNAQQVNSSDGTILTGTANTSAQAAVHNVIVKSLATTASYYTNPATLPATGSTPIATSGSFTITAGALTASITIDGTNNTLTGLAAAINNSAVGTAVNAGVIQDSSGARLTIVSNSSGAPGDFTVTDTGNSTGLNFTKPVTGTNASLTVDGIPISSATNTVTSAIPGVTLKLVAANLSETVTLNVNPDPAQAATAINQFVTAYNKTIGDINAQYVIDSAGNTGVLASDSTLAIVQAQLYSAVNATGSGNIANLGSIGLNLQNDGTIHVDGPTLANALNSNFGAIQSFFQSTTSGVGQALSAGLKNIADPTRGSIALDVQGISLEQSDLVSQISNIQVNLTQEQQNLVTKYSKVNVILQQLPVLQQQISSQLAGA
jgi:flagellar hook-associated protein 2